MLLYARKLTGTRQFSYRTNQTGKHKDKELKQEIDEQATTHFHTAADDQKVRR